MRRRCRTASCRRSRCSPKVGQRGQPLPIVCRLDGNNADEGRRILDGAEHDVIELVDTMDAAARRVAELAAAK